MIAVAFALEFESVCFCARHDPRLRVGVWFLGAMGAAAALSVKRMLIDTVPDLLTLRWICGQPARRTQGGGSRSRPKPIRSEGGGGPFVERAVAHRLCGHS